MEIWAYLTYACAARKSYGKLGTFLTTILTTNKILNSSSPHFSSLTFPWRKYQTVTAKDGEALLIGQSTHMRTTMFEETALLFQEQKC